MSTVPAMTDESRMTPTDASQRLERMPVFVHRTAVQSAAAVAQRMATIIREKAAKGEQAVLGLATGSTPTGVYAELIRLHQEEGLSFRNVVTFNLDEYWPMQPETLQSYHLFMQESLFNHIDIPADQVHIPDGTVDRMDVEEHCRAYEAKIAACGGIDLQLLGIGRTGHIGFNEPGSPRDSRTRLITLDKVTRMDAASDFFGEWNVPRQAITMGVGTILDAREVVLMAFGEHKAAIVRRAVEEDVTNSVSASFLQNHPDARFILDPSAAAELTRFKTPWLLGPLAQVGGSWTPAMMKKAAIWLSLELEKPILKLTDEDYNEHGLQELLTTGGGAYEINIRVFKSLQKTITGWPGGKPGRPRFVVGRGVSSDNPPDVFPKRVLVFSPHPDDDVISMGGTFIRLCDQGHDVHVAYQTSGNIAVFDEEALRHVDFVSELASEFDLFDKAHARSFDEKVRQAAAGKVPGEADSPELRTVKALIRRTEARAAAVFSGVKPDNIHFMDMPFYETGIIKKNPIGPEDIQVTIDLLERVQPHQVYAAGDLSDPHGTHRVCLSAIIAAFNELQDRAWMKECEFWLYRGAWQEWEPHEIEMAVPLSPSEVQRKRQAIFKHESQKDRALFPGPWDTREFWQRAEDRNRQTAERFDALGLPEYQAIEGFVLCNTKKYGYEQA